MIERYQLRYFLAVVDAGGFSRAAKQVNVTQPTLSIGVAKLERALGGPLFVRNSKRVHLTPLGVRILPQARAIEREFNGFETAARPEPLALPVRLGVLATVPTWLIEAVVAANQQAERPDALEIVEGAEGDLMSRLERRRIDLALTVIRPGQDRFRPELLRTEGYSLAVPQTHPLAGEAEVEVEALAGEVMIVRRHCEVLAATSRFFTARGVRPRFSFRTHNDDRAAAMVRAGLGVTVAPDSWREPGVGLVRLAGFEHRRELGLLFGEGWEAGAGRSTPEAVRRALAE
jgi:DNA-binding transcriptional LysR family regulator